jgi:hypothetical protein
MAALSNPSCQHVYLMRLRNCEDSRWWAQRWRGPVQAFPCLTSHECEACIRLMTLQTLAYAAIVSRQNTPGTGSKPDAGESQVWGFEMFVVRICLFVLFVGAPILQDLGRGLPPIEGREGAGRRCKPNGATCLRVERTEMGRELNVTRI